MKSIPPENMSENNNSRDLFYTKQPIAIECVETLCSVIIKEGHVPLDYTWIEPSAGNGAFVRALSSQGITQHKISAFDICPQGEGILQQDFLAPSVKNIPAKSIIIGNPPFGRQSKLAYAFLDRARELGASYIGFILPSGFRSIDIYNRCCATHTRLLCKALPEDAFVSPDGKERHNVCVFCVFKSGASPRQDKALCKNIIKIGSCSWNIHKLKKVPGGWDVFLTGSYHSVPAKICGTSPDVLEQPGPHGNVYRYRAMGISINKTLSRENHKKVLSVLLAIPWDRHAVKHASGVCNINKEQIHQALYDALPEDLRRCHPEALFFY